MYVVVRSSRSGVWGGALPGTVCSLPVVMENRKEVAKSHQYVSSTSTRTMRTFCTGDSYALKIEKDCSRVRSLLVGRIESG